MTRSRLLAALLAAPLAAVSAQVSPATHPLASTDGLRLLNVTAEPVTYKGRRALKVLESPNPAPGAALVILTGSSFRDGTIELDVAGDLRAGAANEMRGFIGLAFDIQSDTRYKSFYLRPTNGRSENQLRRNHATQYIAMPEWTWNRLRQEEPGVYESYADMEPATWIRIRVVVEGTKARLFVGDASQPALVVTDLKDPVRGGAVGLWIGTGTEGYFSNLRIRPAER